MSHLTLPVPFTRRFYVQLKEAQIQGKKKVDRDNDSESFEVEEYVAENKKHDKKHAMKNVLELKNKTPEEIAEYHAAQLLKVREPTSNFDFLYILA